MDAAGGRSCGGRSCGGWVVFGLVGGLWAVGWSLAGRAGGGPVVSESRQVGRGLRTVAG